MCVLHSDHILNSLLFCFNYLKYIYGISVVVFVCIYGFKLCLYKECKRNPKINFRAELELN